MIRVVIIEDEKLVRMGIKTAISQDLSMEVCGEAESGEQGLTIVAQTQPDIVVLDIGLPDMNGLEVLSAIKKNFAIKVLILTCQSAEDVVNSALNLGADSYLLKNSDIELIKYAIRQTFENESWIDPKIAKIILQKNQSLHSYRTMRKGKNYDDLPTERQILILKLIACGLTNEEISNKLFVSPNTIKSHINRLYEKLNVKKRIDAINRGQKLGYIKHNEISPDSFHRGEQANNLESLG